MSAFAEGDRSASGCPTSWHHRQKIFSDYRGSQKHRHRKHVLNALEFDVAAFPKVPVDRIAALVTARLRGEHPQIRAASAGRNQGVIERHRNDVIDGLGRLWKGS